MKTMYFTSRNWKEIIRDPISILLGVALPILLLVVFTLLGKSAPLEIFDIQNITPGIIIFGFTFLTMFSAILIAKDKESSFLMRLFTSPLGATEYIAGYSIALIPLALIQCVVCFITAFLLDLVISANILLTLLVLFPQAIMSIFTGLLFGTMLNESQVQGLGSMYITLSALFSGAWMDLNMIGGIIKKISYALPFSHAIDAARASLAGRYASIFPSLLWPIIYAVVVFLLAAFAFRQKMKA